MNNCGSEQVRKISKKKKKPDTNWLSLRVAYPGNYVVAGFANCHLKYLLIKVWGEAKGGWQVI